MSNAIPYLVQKGDTLSSIAEQLGITPYELQYYHNMNADVKDGIGPEVSEGKTLLTPPQEKIDTYKARRAEQEEAKKEEREEEEKKAAEEEKKQQESARSEHDKKHFVVHKATCFCDQSEEPKKAATLLVTSHDKVILNDQEGKFFATEVDKTFDPPAATFGKCLKQPSSSGYLPCTLAPAPKWEKTFDKTKVFGNKVLTEISTLQCVAYGGKIQVLTNGQIDSVMKEHAENTNPAELALINPAVQMPAEEIKYPIVSSIQLKSLEDDFKFKAVSSEQKKAVEKVTIRQNQECNFEAKVKKGNTNLTSWVIYDGFTGDKDKKLLTNEQTGTLFKNSFAKLGQYRVEGYGKPKKEEFEKGIHDKNYPDCSIDIDVVLNKLNGDSLEPIGGEYFAKVIGGKMRLRQNFPASFKAMFLLVPTEEELEQLRMYVTDASGSIIKSVQVNNTVSFTPKNKKAKYIIKAEYKNEAGEQQSQSFIGETISNTVSGITHNQLVIRPGTPVSFKVKDSTFNLYLPDEADAIADEVKAVKWNLNGRLMGTGLNITIPGHELMYKKEYVVEAFVTLANAHYNKTLGDEEDDWHFEVKDNDVESFVYDEEPKVGKTTQLKVNRTIFEDILTNEHIQWKTTVPHRIIDTKAIAITPMLPGIQKVNCNINGQEGKTLSINVKQTKIIEAFFTDSQGIEIEKASWGQKINIWIKQEYLVGEVLIIEVWDKDKTSPNDVVEIINKKYDGGLISFELSPFVKQKTGDWGNLFIKIGAMHLKMPVFITKDTLDVQNKREIYAAHIGSQDGKERFYQTDYDQVCCFYAKSRGIKETEDLIVSIYDGDRELIVITAVHCDKSGLIKVNLDWNKIKQKLKMRKVNAVVKNSKNEIIYDGSDLATGFVHIYKKAALLKLAEYKSAVWVEKTENGVNKTGTCVCKEYDLIWGNKVSCDFRKKVFDISKKIGLPQEKNEGANWLMAVMALETAYTFSPKIGTFKNNPNENNKNTYVGLIQFGKEAATDVGITRTKLLQMTAEDQLEYVEKYFLQDKFKKLLINKTALYLAVNYPKACKHAANMKYIVYDSNKDAYDDNDLFKREKHEYKIIKGKKVYPDEVIGSSYVWEFEEAINEVAENGKKNKANDFTCSFNQVKFNAKDVITYRIYSNGDIEKHIPKHIKKGFEQKYNYIYHDNKSNEHQLGLFNFKLTKEMDPGNVAGKKDVELIDVREFKGYSNNGVKLKFSTLNTESERYYINPNCYAGLLGAMASMNIDYLGFNGFSNYQAKSTGGSQSHRNGEKGDLRYLSKNKRGEATILQDSHFDIENQNKFNDALYKFGWARNEKMYSEYFTNIKPNYLLNHTKHMRKDGIGGYRHHHHLHLTGFNHSLIKKINEK